MSDNDPVHVELVTPDQVKAARELLGWSRERLGSRSETSAHIVTVFENTGRVIAAHGIAGEEMNALAAIRAALEAGGVEFIDPSGGGDGVRMRKPGFVKASPPTELSQAEIKRSAAVLLYLLNWQKGFDNDRAVRSLRDAKLDVAVVVTPSGHPRVHEKVLNAFRDLAGHSATWDSTTKVWRARRKDDPA